MRRVVIAGALANKPRNGGEAWVRLTWMLGFARLGFDTYFVEQIDRAHCTDAAGEPTDFHRSVNRAFFRHVCDQFDLTGRAVLVTTDGGETEGMAWDDAIALADGTDLLVNISGHLTVEALRRRFRRSLFLDVDPGFTQFWHASGLADQHLVGHDAYFTIGANIGDAACPIPTGGIPWQATRPPVLLDAWPMVEAATLTKFTTVATWRATYGPVEYDGATYGLKHQEFRKIVALPLHAPYAFELALDIRRSDRSDYDALVRNGWKIVDPAEVAADPLAYRAYIQASGAECSAAQGMYVATRSGWISDRTVQYLASGKPVLIQDTGLPGRYATGKGLVTFDSIDGAAMGAARIGGDYPAHCRAARTLAERHFSSDLVIAEVLARLRGI